MLLTRLFVLVVLCYDHVICSKKLCDLDDSVCLTEAVKRIKEYSNAQPLHVKLIEANLPTVKYTLTNTTLSGLNTCAPELVKINEKEMIYAYHIACTHLTMDGLYEVNGVLGPLPIEGAGDFKVHYDDYVFRFNGGYEQKIDKDGKVHYNINNFELDIDARGKVIYGFNNLFNGDNEKAAALHKYVHENGQTVNKIMRQPVMGRFMALHIEKVNAFLAKVPVEDLFTES